MNTTSKEVLNITKGEWVVERNGIIVSNEMRGLILATVNDRPQYPDNAKAICDAINFTYGKGLNPAAMEQLYKALEELLPVIVTKHVKYNYLYDKAKTALQNSKL